MTARDKQGIAAFLDLAEDMLRDGHRTEHEARVFSDDAIPQTAARIEPGAAAAPPRTSGETTNVVEGDSLQRIADEVRACTACPLAATRKQAVSGEGSAKPLVMVIGEGPGADEDATGRPFVGKAGQLLDKMLASVGLGRETNCFIANVVKCRPPNNRDPEPTEIAACSRFLDRQMAILAPKAILTVGRVPTQALLATTEGIGRLRGRFVDFRGTPLLPTYHPSALLRDETLKRPAWEDLKTLRAKLAELNGGNAGMTEPSAENGDR